MNFEIHNRYDATIKYLPQKVGIQNDYIIKSLKCEFKEFAIQPREKLVNYYEILFVCEEIFL